MHRFLVCLRLLAGSWQSQTARASCCHIPACVVLHKLHRERAMACLRQHPTKKWTSLASQPLLPLIPSHKGARRGFVRRDQQQKGLASETSLEEIQVNSAWPLVWPWTDNWKIALQRCRRGATTSWNELVDLIGQSAMNINNLCKTLFCLSGVIASSCALTQKMGLAR